MLLPRKLDVRPASLQTAYRLFCMLMAEMIGLQDLQGKIISRDNYGQLVYSTILRFMCEGGMWLWSS